MENNTTQKANLADLKPVKDSPFNNGATPLSVSLSMRTGVKDTRPYHVLDFTVSRGDVRLTYNVFARDNDVAALAMLGLHFPPAPVPAPIANSSASVAAVATATTV